MYKEYLALNNLDDMNCHKTHQPTKLEIFNYLL